MISLQLTRAFSREVWAISGCPLEYDAVFQIEPHTAAWKAWQSLEIDL
jgi:hypothetical protein